MEKVKKRLFIVLEAHMEARYAYMIQKFDFCAYHVADFGTLQMGASWAKVKERIHHRYRIEEAYSKLQNWIHQELEKAVVHEVYLSNTEGYIAHNLITRLKKDFPHLTLIGLQHGIFNLSRIPKRFFRSILNLISKLFFGIYPLGIGFGGKIVSKYIVYNQAYKDFLVREYDWKPEEIRVDFEFLKVELFDKRKDDLKEEDTAVFLLQGLAKANLCSVEEEAYLIRNVTKYLSAKHKQVLIKEHPVFKDEKRIQILDNISYEWDLIRAFNRSSYAYSFNSTTLLESELFGIDAYAIDSSKIIGDKNIYKLFKNTINFEERIDI